MSALNELIEISRFYGGNPAYVIAGGGNTSYKDGEKIWVKASGIPLAGIKEGGFVCLSRGMLTLMEEKSYPEDPVEREEMVKEDMQAAILSPENLRPSVETSLHNLIPYSYVVHTHPTLVNGLMCSVNARELVEERFGEDALYVEYTDPGYILFKKIQQGIVDFQLEKGFAPRIIFLQNHGVFVAASTTREIRRLYNSIDLLITGGKNPSIPSCVSRHYESVVTRTLQDYFASRELVTKAVRCDLIDHFNASTDRFLKVSRPFSPDIIVYCKSSYLFLGKGASPELVASACDQFLEMHGYYPKVILEEGGGLIGVEEQPASLDTVMAVFIDLMKISYLSESFGGPHFMTDEQIRFIDNWEVENYRRKVAKGRS